MVTPFYEQDGITIYHADCREVLPFVTANLLLTDPPYGIGVDSGSHLRGNTQRKRQFAMCKDYGPFSWDQTPPPWLITQCIAVANHAIIWGGNYFALPRSSCWLVWDKDNGTTGYADCELAWTNLDKAVRRYRYRWSGMLQEFAGDDKETRWHPTQKPVSVMRWAIEQAPTSDVVLDPFMGVGSTLRAAKDLGRQAIGIEIEERYCEIAARRLSQMVLPFDGAA